MRELSKSEFLNRSAAVEVGMAEVSMFSLGGGAGSVCVSEWKIIF